MRKIIFLFLLIPGLIRAQEKEKFAGAGELQLGLRNTLSVFGDAGYPGYGVGGQFRLRLSKMLNTEWFADYFTTNLGGLGKRADGHIGWSVMFYPFNKLEGKKIQPYFLAGHCFDYTKVTPFSTVTLDRSGEAKSRWSSATQAGLGTHFFISDHFNLSLSAQYMIHLGKDIHADIHEHGGVPELHIEDNASHDNTLEGHLLITLSLNIKIANLW